MMFKRRVAVVFSAAILGLLAVPATADLFSFTLGSAHTTWDGTTLTTTPSSFVAVGTVTRVKVPTGEAAVFGWPLYSGGGFSLTMGFSYIGTTSANASGSFVFTDTGGDTIGGDISGEWLRDGNANSFHGVLSNVEFTDNHAQDGEFNGHLGTYVSMAFPGYPTPWVGSFVELTGTAPWFTSNFPVEGVENGTVGGNVNAVPIPAAVLLGFLGLTVAGVKLRQYA